MIIYDYIIYTYTYTYAYTYTYTYTYTSMNSAKHITPMTMIESDILSIKCQVLAKHGAGR